MSKSLSGQILDVLKYFAYFKYAPSFEEIYTFLPVKTTRKELTKNLQNLTIKRSIIHNVRHSGKSKRSEDASRISTKYTEKTLDFARVTNTVLSSIIYTLPGHSTFFSKRAFRAVETENQLKKVSQYISLLTRFPGIKLIGLSGSCAMGYASKKDDVDLFIIASRGYLWTTRFFALFLAQFMGVRRNRGVNQAPGKVCLNLLFNERDLLVPYYKQNKYVAHEVLQMKPLVNKDHAYEKFLKANEWVGAFFPNALALSSRSQWTKTIGSGDLKKKRLPRSPALAGALAMTGGSCIEYFLKTFQLIFINRHRTTEIITDTQLWFFPHDFEKKLRRKKIV